MHRSRANGRPSTSQLSSPAQISTRMSQVSTSDSALTALEADAPGEEDEQEVISTRTRPRKHSSVSQATISNGPPSPQETLNVRRGSSRPQSKRNSSAAGTPVASSSLIVNPKRASSKPKPIYQRAEPEGSCAFCECEALALPDGNIETAEDMLSCFNCGSSAHPACLKFENENTLAGCRTYDWMCQECKRCEVCGKDSVCVS